MTSDQGRPTLKTLGTILALVVLALVVGVIFVYSGVYPIGADVPHAHFVSRMLHRVSDRAVEHHARGVQVPDWLEAPDSTTMLKAAGQYAAMCSGCHLAPGYDRGPLHDGLYPRPPRFTRGTDMPPAEFFWETKHGIKDTGMPAWGKTHSDDELWPIVAFVEHMHEMTPEQYRALVTRAPKDEDMAELPMPGGEASSEKGREGGGG